MEVVSLVCQVQAIKTIQDNGRMDYNRQFFLLTTDWHHSIPILQDLTMHGMHTVGY